MINELRRQGIEEILSFLDDHSLTSLAKTVTQGLIKNIIQSRQEATNAIIKYSPDEISILKRKIVTKEVLFSYLHSKNINITSPFTKIELIAKILHHWNNIIENNTKVGQCGDNFQPNHVALLAEQFSQWFYPILNSTNPIGSEHFFEDATLKITMFQNKQISQIIESSSNELICQQLFSIKSQYGLFFNPNYSSEGVQGRMDPHGLVVVLVCGTLHSSENCVGIFEQVFFLTRDPFSENNWKVKVTELNLKSQSGVVGSPALLDDEFTSKMLSLPSN